jgi:hypothetical protein
MKEFDFEQAVRKAIKQLKQDLLTYKAQLTNEFRTTDNAKPVEQYQIRKLLTTPAEYILIYDIEDTGLVHAVPLTTYTNLTTSNLRIYITNYTLAPLPFYVYLNSEALQKISVPFAIVKPETVEKVLQDLEKTHTISHIKPIKEFVELVWKKYEQLVLASLLYNVIKQEELDN